MSTQSIVNSDNLATSTVAATAIAEYGVDLMKHIRFEAGQVCRDEMRDLLRLYRLNCMGPCYFTDEQKRLVREYIIKGSIRKIEEL